MLAVERLSCRFGPAYALRDVSLSVRAGEVVTLLGENGAGKSTLIKILAGVYQPTTGQIRLAGSSFAHGVTPADAKEAGLAFVHQDLGLLGELSVAENIAHVAGFETLGGLVSWRRQRRRARDILEEWKLDLDVDARVDRLEAAERALVAIARALAADAKAIVFDEPTASLPRADVEVLFSAVDRLRDGGVGVVYVTHRLTEVQRLGDRAIVLRDGRSVGEVSVAATNEDELVQLIVGRELAHLHIDKPSPSRSVALSLEGVAGGGVESVSLTVHDREILALAGLIGAGQRSVGRIVAGVETGHTGTMSLRGEPYRPASPGHAQRVGVNYVPGNRLEEGGFPTLPSGENFAVRCDRSLRLLNRRSEYRSAAKGFVEWSVAPSNPETPFGVLSGGNQQKIVISKWMRDRPTLLVADEPTAGVDVGARAAIQHRLIEATQAGMAMLLVSSDAEEVAGLAHRVIVFRDGLMAAELFRDKLTVDQIALECYRA